MFKHPAINLQTDKMLVYTAMSKHYFYYRMHISKFVLEQGMVPLNPFMIFDYFLLDSVNRDLIREGNNNLVKRVDQVWVFGPISNGVLAEIKIAKNNNKQLSYFKIQRPHSIISISESEVELEVELKDELNTMSLSV